MVQSSESSLASIAQSLRGIASVMKTLNENLVEFAKQAREKPEVIQMPESSMSVAYRKALAERCEGYAGGIDPEYNKVARVPNEFDEHFQKEGE